MISQRTVTILGTLTLVSLIGAGLAIADRVSETRTAVSAERAFPVLDDRVEQVSAIAVSRRAADTGALETATLRRDGDRWVFEERDGYPARSDVIRKVLFDLSQIDLLERRTSDRNRLDRLDLRPVEDAGSRAKRVRLLDAGGEALVDVHIGKTRDSLSGGEPMLYLRRSDAEQTYLAEGELALPEAARDWMFREITNIAKDQIASSVIVTRDGEILAFERPEGETDFALVDLPEGRKVKSNYTVNNIAGMLDKFSFTDVRAAEGLDFDPALGSGTFTLTDGTVVRLALAETEAAGAEDPATWVQVTLDVPDGADTERTAEIRARTEGWAYRLSDYVLDRFRQSVEDLTQPIEGS